MNWIKSKIIKWVREDWISAKVAVDEGIKQRPEDISSNETIRFNLTPAMGGRILRVTRDTNQKTLGPSDNTQLYVIPSGEDVGQRVAKIINLELLK
jgi:hypothetical protein